MVFNASQSYTPITRNVRRLCVAHFSKAMTQNAFTTYLHNERASIYFI
uniref:Uncharacterized protein n=1 Tax=Lepeophtheirus salmonis TaxID=72036 RepID=A0A0K2UTB2_LEPSM